MNFLCPSCRTPLPRIAPEQVTCTGCGVAVDLTRVETAPGQARLWPELDLSGETLGGFELVRLLGSGGMGSVYEARTSDGARVAVKVLAPLLAAEPALRERFGREARALAALTHPNIVRMLGEGEARSFCWYAMELVEGVDLRERLKQGPLPAEEVEALARTLLDALSAVHQAGFVHRDVKPSNVLLSPVGPKLCDFGIARVEGAHTLTESAALLGSLRYMAPEQRWGKSDARSDLYALGVVLHEALALGVPGERSLPPKLPAGLARLIVALTETSPSKRPTSAEEAKRLLQRPRLGPVPIAAALVTLAVVGTAGVLSQLPGPEPALVPPTPRPAPPALPKASPTPLETFALPTPEDAGADVVATANPSNDAGQGAVAEPQTDLDAGVALRQVANRKVESPPLAGLLGDRSERPDPSKPTVPPVKKPKPVGVAKLLDGSIGTLGTGTASPPKTKRKSLSTAPPDEAPLDKAPPDKAPPDKAPPDKAPPDKAPLQTAKPEALQGSISVTGSGVGTVYVDKQPRGQAPGTFAAPVGAHLVLVRCAGSGKKGGPVRSFKVTLTEDAPSTEVIYDCPKQ